jgi:ubiquinone/menaquinone biosynthesis C-methylase UbiE
MSNAERIGAAYDTVAADYDRQLEPAGWIRRMLWRHFDRLFKPGDKVLDVGCGTGLDAIHLARRQVRVTAIDASPQMLARFRAKLAGESTPADVDIRLGRIDEIASELIGPFDGIISSFAALNTVDLSAFAPQAARLLRPGGRLICHLLSTRYGRSTLGRFFGRAPSGSAAEVKTIDVGTESLSHVTLEPDELYRRFFAETFERRRCYALGLLVSGRMDSRLPKPLLDFVGRVEAVIGGAPPLVSRGRFFVLDLERRAP